MAGDPTKASHWPDADVYVAPLATAVPATAATAFGVGWNLVGLLDGDSGFPEAREEDVADHYAWGGILVRTTRRQFKSTKRFTALEDNTTTKALIWPGSTTTALSVPRPINQLVAFETREGAKIKRLITANYAQVAIDGDITDSEGDLTRYEFIATIFPTGAGVLFTRQDSV